MKATEDTVLTIGLRLFGARRLAGVFGYAVLLVAVAPAGADRRWVLDHGPMSVPTRYRRVADLAELREALEAGGYEVDGLDEDSGTLAVAVRMAA